MISIIIPVFNRSSLIGNLLESIMKTAIKEYEIIVVDDKSTDESINICRRYPSVNVVEMKAHAGPARARNLGAKQACGDVLIFIDADVLLPEDEDVLLKIAKVFVEHPQVDCVSTISDVHPVDANAIAYNNSIYHVYYMNRILAGKASRMGNIMFFTSRLGGIRTEKFKKSGGFHESLHTVMNEDGEFATRCYHMGFVSYFDKELHHRHKYPTSFKRLINSYFKSAFVQAIIDRKYDTAADPSISSAEKYRRIFSFLLITSPLLLFIMNWQVWLGITLSGAVLFLLLFGTMNRLIWQHVPKIYLAQWYIVYLIITPFIFGGYFCGVVRFYTGTRRILNGAPSMDEFFKKQ